MAGRQAGRESGSRLHQVVPDNIHSPTHPPAHPPTHAIPRIRSTWICFSKTDRSCSTNSPAAGRGKGVVMSVQLWGLHAWVQLRVQSPGR